MKYLLIMNPGSRSGKGKRLWKTWESRLNQAGAEYVIAYTERRGHAIELARAAKTEVVVAVGGDGTINEVLDGAMQSANPNLKMGVLYSGTSPDFCRFHGIPIRPEAAVDALLSNRTRRVDVARITYSDSQGRELTAHFGCSCNIGMGASVARYANRWRRYLGDIPGTCAALVRTLARNARPELDLTLDGSPRRLPAVNNLTIAKNPFLASGLKLQLDLLRDDGELALVAISGKSRGGILRLLPRLYTGSVTRAKDVLVEECRAVAITCKEPQEIEFDGDPRGFLPARIEILPGALSLIGGIDE